MGAELTGTEMLDDVVTWRRHIHAHPELGYEVEETAGFVAEKLRTFGCDEVVTGVGRTGVVATIDGQVKSSGRVVGLRADMDALPMGEETGLPYASVHVGRMHACGHDGHTAMLLGAARHLARTRQFDGTVVLIFQPAEEGGGGGLAMCEDGLMERWGIQQVFALHNEPGLPIGRFSTATGPLAAAADGFRIQVEGKGTHGADPHLGVDTLLATANILMALQSVVARNLHPMKAGVVTVGSFHGGSAGNIIPQRAEMVGTVRSFDPAIRDMLQGRVVAVAEGIAASYGATATVKYRRMFPPVVNHEHETELAVRVASVVVGPGNVQADKPPLMGSEDFAFMLERRPGNIMLIGNGATASLHEVAYDFNDDALPYGIRYWITLIEMLMPCEKVGGP